ncbi:unnamed protein product [Linum tenue]|uniref:Uncharacterized protein n=1 Tax=Linum tenue TaxID=586396 RepID=A0AAV0KZT1_9ROSI|nr:unnamed protein product [Linum tenue]
MSELLNQFEYILDYDPLINEVGFIHPSQFATLEKDSESGSSRLKASDALDGGDGSFWIRDHKLGISSEVVLRLYKAAREQFMNAIAEYKKLGDLSLPSAEALGIVVMKCSKTLLLLNSDFGTAWNSRKLILSNKTQASMFTDELRLSTLVLSYSTKSEQAWSHRRWVIKNMARNLTTLQEILSGESDLVEKIAEMIQELKQSKTWAGLHVADHSCFHYRMRLIIRILEDCCRKQEEGSCDSCVEVYLIWQEELDWNEELIKRYLGREALWLYRRFLSLLWIRHFTSDVNDVFSPQKSQSSIQVNVNAFLDKELLLVNSCSEGSDDEFEDFEEQAICSASYMLWLTKGISFVQQIPETQKLELREKIENERLDAMLKLVSLRGPPFGAI